MYMYMYICLRRLRLAAHGWCLTNRYYCSLCCVCCVCQTGFSGYTGLLVLSSLIAHSDSAVYLILILGLGLILTAVSAMTLTAHCYDFDFDCYNCCVQYT
jgi:hypothetical protein